MYLIRLTGGLGLLEREIQVGLHVYAPISGAGIYLRESAACLSMMRGRPKVGYEREDERSTSRVRAL